jgi:hypothetical protein
MVKMGRRLAATQATISLLATMLETRGIWLPAVRPAGVVVAAAIAALDNTRWDLAAEKGKRLPSVIFDHRGEAPRPFSLVRETDVSAPDTVALGAEWPDGTVVLRWTGQWPSTVVYECIEAVEAVHGRGGATRVIWPSEDLGENAGTEAQLDAVAAWRDAVRRNGLAAAVDEYAAREART